MNPETRAQTASGSATEKPLTSATERQRVRITYTKDEHIKFISHQDEFRAWERTLRRADLPLLYKQGFNPQPHIQFASPLGVGFTGIQELIDVTFSPPLPIEELVSRIEASLPPGLNIHHAEEVPVKTKALQSLLIGADYWIIIFASPGEVSGNDIEKAIVRLLDQSEIWRQRERKGKSYRYNLRPLIFELRYGGYDAATEEHHIRLRVQQRAGATGRPDEVVDALGLDDYARTLQRRQLYFSHIPEHVDLFARYPVITQDEIAASTSRHVQKQTSRKQKKAAPSGRTIAERAADEFT